MNLGFFLFSFLFGFLPLASIKSEEGSEREEEPTLVCVAAKLKIDVSVRACYSSLGLPSCRFLKPCEKSSALRF